MVGVDVREVGEQLTYRCRGANGMLNVLAEEF